LKSGFTDGLLIDRKATVPKKWRKFSRTHCKNFAWKSLTVTRNCKLKKF